MKKMKKILIAGAAMLLVVGIIVACEMFRQHKARNSMTYEEYNALTAEEQEKHFYSFDSVEDFFAWYNKAKAEYEKNQDYTEIGGDGEIDIGGAGKNE